MSRNERRAVRKELVKRARAYPEQLEVVPESEWPAMRPGGEPPYALWRSRAFLVQGYQEPYCVRLTVVRVTMGADLQWQDGITWDELQQVKREAGYGDYYAVEVYPREKDVVCDCKMRHLWVLPNPLPIGWVRE